MVVANDGVNSGSAIADSLTLAVKSPSVRIKSPEDGAMFAAGDRIVFCKSVGLKQPGMPMAAACIAPAQELTATLSGSVLDSSFCIGTCSQSGRGSFHRVTCQIRILCEIGSTSSTKKM
jgi:hypothetical protein